mmetsp:Transcript_20921/g.37665  ORF Transcript_20921/g.37665 Transcript_20921/m.37665 type:complete len:207 (+) Transcript_20921:173-793(+)
MAFSISSARLKSGAMLSGSLSSPSVPVTGPVTAGLVSIAALPAGSENSSSSSFSAFSAGSLVSTTEDSSAFSSSSSFWAGSFCSCNFFSFVVRRNACGHEIFAKENRCFGCSSASSGAEDSSGFSSSGAFSSAGASSSGRVASFEALEEVFLRASIMAFARVFLSGPILRSPLCNRTEFKDSGSTPGHTRDRPSTKASATASSALK